MYKAKRTIAALVAGAMLLSTMVGCNTGGTTPSTSSQSTASVSSTTVPAAEVKDISADVRGNEAPTEETVKEVRDTLNDSYLGDLYDSKIPSNYEAYPMSSADTLEIWSPIDAFLSSIIPSLNDFEVYKKQQELTGIQVKFVSPPVGQENDQFSIMIASGELPDIIYQADKYGGGLEAGMADGAYIDLSETIPQYAPNYDAFRNGDENRRKTTVTDTGKLVGFYGLSPYSEWMWFGMLIKQEALDKTGLPVPETVDELYTFLVKCKEVGFSQPLNYGSTYGQIFTDIINGAYGVYDWKFVDENGKIGWGPGQPGAKDYLTTMAKWQAEGLLNTDWTTADFNQRMAEAVSDDCAIMMDSPDTMWGFWKTNNDIDFVAALNPVLKKGDKPTTTYKNWSNTGNPAAITTQCDNVELAARWLDFGFTKKGWELLNWGSYSDVHLVNEEGRPYFQSSSLMYNDPEGQPLANLIWKYRVHSGPNIRDEHFSNPLITAKDSYSGEIRKTWTENMSTDPAVPPITLTPEEASREATLGTQLSTLRNEYFAKIIMGQLPVDAYDEFLQTAQQMGVQEWVDIWQAGLDRYNKR